MGKLFLNRGVKTLVPDRVIIEMVRFPTFERRARDIVRQKFKRVTHLNVKTAEFQWHRSISALVDKLNVGFRHGFLLAQNRVHTLLFQVLLCRNEILSIHESERH